MNSVGEIIINTTGYSLFTRILLSMFAMNTASLSRKVSSLHTVCSSSSNDCLKAMRVECECPVVMYLVTIPALQCVHVEPIVKLLLEKVLPAKTGVGMLLIMAESTCEHLRVVALPFFTLKHIYPNVTTSLYKSIFLFKA